MISYGEIAELTNVFDEQCKELGIVWIDEEVEEQAFGQFVSDYENGDENPQVLLCGYGYESINK